MLKHFLLLCGLTLIFSCEEVIDLEVPNSEPRLVIEASINWFEGTLGNEQEIKLSLTAPYFNSDIPPANGAQVSIINPDGSVIEFFEVNQTGRYVTGQFNPQLGATYILQITYLGEVYEATEVMQSVTPIDYVLHEQSGGFSGD